MVLGLQRTGGVLAFIGSVGQYKERLALAIVLAGHEIDGVVEVWFHDKPVTVDPSGSVTTAPYMLNSIDSGASVFPTDGVQNVFNCPTRQWPAASARRK